MRRVGIVGGGAAGLCAARHVLASGKMTPLVWESTANVGGTWKYSPAVGRDAHGNPIHSSMYKNLRTNLPKEVMAFPDFPFPEGGDSFVHHSVVAKYLQDYSSHFDVSPWIKHEHLVEKVSPVTNEEGGTSWAITARDLNGDSSSTTICDAVFICNGHYSVPKVPTLPGIERYSGRQVHSHDYREPSSFRGATVLVLGAGASGLDIAIELATEAKEVILSHKLPKPVTSPLPPNMRQVAAATAATEDGFVLSDGSSVKADIILYCTGYEYTFPFLDPECGVRVEGNQVKPLYKHMINCDFPSMAFLGIPVQICPFPMFDFQVRFFLQVLTGKLPLPSAEEMKAEVEREVEERLSNGVESRHFHNMSILQWEYTRDMAALAGIHATKPVVEKLFTAVREMRNQALMTYKENKYRITGSDSFERVG
ncbi:flavin-containing monooxygenase FMO GS-OX-like 4 [Penaeus japonicus]|uniref:flavin-containing monooxygenase FMO GS-OX-like 4 n=1 Tax=Penaeus japonicus TaxID=27405 RepID=UPI001C70B4D0|nr:flavin-containing monooxygenase FMO GS-OX-like 4 [Penaeus japonicus]